MIDFNLIRERVNKLLTISSNMRLTLDDLDEEATNYFISTAINNVLSYLPDDYFNAFRTRRYIVDATSTEVILPDMCYGPWDSVYGINDGVIYNLTVVRKDMVIVPFIGSWEIVLNYSELNPAPVPEEIINLIISYCVQLLQENVPEYYSTPESLQRVIYTSDKIKNILYDLKNGVARLPSLEKYIVTNRNIGGVRINVR